MDDIRRTPDKIKDIDLNFTDSLSLNFDISFDEVPKDKKDEQDSTDKR